MSQHGLIGQVFQITLDELLVKPGKGVEPQSNALYFGQQQVEAVALPGVFGFVG